MNIDFEKCSRDIKETRQRAQALISGLTSEQLTRQPAPGKWSVAECILHLNVTATVVQPLMEQAIEKGRRDKKVGKGPFAIGLRGRLLVWVAEPPPKFRMPAPKSVRPAARIDRPEKLLPDFLRVQDDWERLIQQSAGLNLAKIRIGPLFSPFGQRLAGAFPWMLAHQRRHLLQAENVKRQISSAAPKAVAQSG